MAVIVAFGDSNTWGSNPAGGERFPADVRWTGIMRHALGDGHAVIEEGLGGRTTVFDDPVEPHRRGADYLPACLLSHAPLDLIIIALGCNDTKARFHVPAGDIARGMEILARMALDSDCGPGGAAPQVIIVAPPPVGKLTAFAEAFAGAEGKSKALGARYREVAERLGVGFVDAGDFIRASDIDGIHYEADQHAILGQVMAEAVRMMLE